VRADDDVYFAFGKVLQYFLLFPMGLEAAQSFDDYRIFGEPFGEV